MKKDIDFLYEIGSLRFISRTWTQFSGGNFANVTEHTFRMALIALILAKMEDANIERTILIAMLHDLHEIRTGDVNYLSRHYTSRDEAKAMEGIVGGTQLETEALKYFKEMEEGITLEAKIVKDADILDCDFELFEQAANGNILLEVWSDIRKKAHEELATESAKKLLIELQSKSPHDWHISAVENTISDK